MTAAKDDIEKIDELYQKMEQLREELNKVLPNGSGVVFYIETYDFVTRARAKQWETEHSEFLEWMRKHNM